MMTGGWVAELASAWTVALMFPHPDGVRVVGGGGLARRAAGDLTGFEVNPSPISPALICVPVASMIRPSVILYVTSGAKLPLKVRDMSVIRCARLVDEVRIVRLRSGIAHRGGACENWFSAMLAPSTAVTSARARPWSASEAHLDDGTQAWLEIYLRLGHVQVMVRVTRCTFRG